VSKTTPPKRRTPSGAPAPEVDAEPTEAPPGTPNKRAAQQQAATAPAALETVELTKTYGELVALSPLSLRIEPTESVALVGHNGSGKTTLLRMAAGLLDTSEGQVTIHGHDAGSLPARAALSYLSDQPTFYEDLSVWEHLDYTARLHGAAEWEQRGADLLGHLGIYDRADDLPVTFSRGLRQKAQIAIALIRPFAVLIVDEPFVGLDAGGKKALLELFDEARTEGATLIVATHELSFVDRVDRVIALRNGELIHDSTPAGVDVAGLVG
jgi:ABC-2 type transport system ATP-binding protein